MGFFARFGRLYDSVVADSTALAKAVRGTAPSAGERRMAALSGGVGQAAYPGAWGAEKSNQVQQFNGWLSSCVRYKARLVGTCPRAVKTGTSAEKDKDRGEYKRLSKAYHAGAVSAPPARRKWLGVPYRKAAVSPDKARDSEELEHLDDDHDLSRLLADPNGPDVGLVFWPYFAAFFYLCGESFIWKVRDGAGDVNEMWVLPAHWVTPRSDGQRFFAEYEVRAWGSAGGMETIDAEDIIHWRSPGLSHPAAPFSEAQAASAVIDTQAMIQWVRYSLLQNGAQIGGVLELPEGMSDISDTAMNRLLAKFQGQFSGVWNSGRPLIVPGGGSYTHPPADLELALGGSEDQARRNVMAAFGLDETLMGFSDEATYAGTAVTWKRLRKSIVEPDQRVLAAVLTERLAAEFGDEYAVIFPDEGGMEDPAEKRANWQAAMQHPAGPAVTLNEVRVELLGLEPSDEEAADDLFGSPGLVPLDQMGAMNDLSGMLGEGGGVMGGDSPEGFGLADDFLADDPTADDPDAADDGGGKKKAASLPSAVWPLLAAALIDLRLDAGEDTPDHHEPEADALLAPAKKPAADPGKADPDGPEPHTAHKGTLYDLPDDKTAFVTDDGKLAVRTEPVPAMKDADKAAARQAVLDTAAEPGPGGVRLDEHFQAVRGKVPGVTRAQFRDLMREMDAAGDVTMTGWHAGPQDLPDKGVGVIKGDKLFYWTRRRDAG
jgi:phage portal protein BeeE